MSETELPTIAHIGDHVAFKKGEDRPKRSKSIAKIAEALAKAQGQMLSVEKDASGTFSAYGTLASTWVAIRKPLSENGIAVYQRPLIVDGKSTMCTMLLHSSGEFFDDSELELKAEGGSRMTPMQALGSAVTYARRYTLQAAAGVAPQDDDGEGSGEPEKKQQQRPPPEKKAEQKQAPPAQQKPKDPPAPPAPPPAFFDKPKEPLTVMQKMELGRYVFPGGKFKGKKLGDVPSNDIMSYRNDIYIEFPDGGPNPMPLAARDIINRIEAYYHDQIK